MALTKIRIGIFDSGLGGLSILWELMKLIGECCEFDYIADTAYMPYGLKSDEAIEERVEFLYSILKKRGADLVVIACNTATAAGIDRLRINHPNEKIVGVEPYLNLPENLMKDTIGVLTTKSTGKSGRFLKLYSKLEERMSDKKKLKSYVLPNLATIVENYGQGKMSKGQLEGQVRMELEKYVDGNNCYTILGCTHYTLIDQLIENILQTKTLSTTSAVAKRVVSLLDLEKKGCEAELTYQYWSTGESDNFAIHDRKKDIFKIRFEDKQLIKGEN